MDKNTEWGKEKLAERVIKSLEKNNMEGFYVKDEQEALEKVKTFLKEGSTVADGGSMTLDETGIRSLLRCGNYNFLDRGKDGLTREEVVEIYKKSFFADTYVTSSNAITEAGEIYNIDGNGNRVAAMIYGPEQVVIVVGINKIVKNLDEAKNRLETYSAPVNMKRLNNTTPCTKSGICQDCKGDARGCCDYVVIKHQRIKGRIKVVIVGKELGY